MPWRLQRFQEACCLHFITFSCQNRDPLLADPRARRVLAHARTLACLVRILRLRLRRDARTCPLAHQRTRTQEAFNRHPNAEAKYSSGTQPLEGAPFWEPRYYDFNVWSEAKRVEKLRYIHRNPVRRGLVERPEDWEWSSFRHYASGADCIVKIESQWTERKRENMGIRTQLKRVKE